MQLSNLLMDDGKLSKGSVGLWISVIILLTITILLLINNINLDIFKELSSTWTYILLIFSGYKTGDKFVKSNKKL